MTALFSSTSPPLLNNLCTSGAMTSKAGFTNFLFVLQNSGRYVCYTGKEGEPGALFFDKADLAARCKCDIQDKCWLNLFSIQPNSMCPNQDKHSAAMHTFPPEFLAWIEPQIKAARALKEEHRKKPGGGSNKRRSPQRNTQTYKRGKR